MSKGAKSKKRKPNLSGVPSWMVKGAAGKCGRDDFQKWRDRTFFTGASKASEVKRIDPETGQVITVDLLETKADKLLEGTARVPGYKHRAKSKKAKKRIPSITAKAAFYRSWQWRTARTLAIQTHGRRCQCCGATPSKKDMTGRSVRIVVDHIKPISRYWELRLDPDNFQVLCEECNQGKGNWDETDYRSPATAE